MKKSEIPSNYLEVNRSTWNKLTPKHVDSEFYDNESFLKGRSSLNPIELEILGDIKGKSLLHLQCHFGQDSISLARLGAKVTGIDLSDKAIEAARTLSEQCNTPAKFVVSDVYDLPNRLEGQFDWLFSSYGTIGWLPDIKKWAKVVSHFLAPGGQILLVEFHPAVWMYDDNFKDLKYRYFNDGPIIDEEEGSYADESATQVNTMISWNHALSEVFSACLEEGLELKHFGEYDHSPYNCFKNMEKVEEGKFRMKQWGNKMPMLYSMVFRKKGEPI